MAILDNRYNKEVMDIILAKYAAGETSVEEDEVVKRWVEESEGNRNYMNGLLQIVEQIHQSKSTDADEEAAWTGLSEKMAGARNHYRVIYPYYKWIAAAAVIILLTGTVFLALRIFNNPPKETSTVVRVINGDGARPDTLPDGTRIVLNKNSSLHYTTAFNVSMRSVKLLGGGYFSIVHNPAKPFSITVNDLLIKDVGTSFKIESDSNKTIVTVQSGIVEITRQRSSITLGQGEQLQVLKTDTVLKKQPAEIPASGIQQIPADTVVKRSYGAGLPGDPSKQKQIVRNILEDIIKDHLVTSSIDSIQSFALTIDGFVINGQQQPAAIQATFRKKFHIKIDKGFFYGPVTITGKGYFISKNEINYRP